MICINLSKQHLNFINENKSKKVYIEKIKLQMQCDES